jgi:hypothetical protein
LVGDGHHPTQFGDEIIASKFFRAMLQHDGLPVPAWDQQEVNAVRKAFETDPSLRAPSLGRNPFEVDDNHDGWLSEEECAAHKVGENRDGHFVPFRYVTPWKPQDDGLKIPTVPAKMPRPRALRTARKATSF